MLLLHDLLENINLLCIFLKGILSFYWYKFVILTSKFIISVLLRQSSFWIGSYSEIYQQCTLKIPSKKSIFKGSSSESINKNACEGIHISESCSISMNKMLDNIHLRRNSFFLVYHIRYFTSQLYFGLFLMHHS